MVQVTGKSVRPMEGFRMMINEGGVTSMWRGNGANVVKIAPEKAFKLLFYDEIKRLIQRDDINRTFTTPERMFAAGSAGIMAHAIIFPLEIAKTRMVMQETGKTRGIFRTLREAYILNGYKLFFKGFITSSVGIVTFCTIDLASYETSQLANMCWKNSCSRTIQTKPNLTAFKKNRLAGEVVIFQRSFRTSLILYEDKIISAPAFPESVTEGDIRWVKGVGDNVNTDEVVCEIETDKTAIAVPAPGPGVIAERFIPDGATVKAGQQLFRITLGAAPSEVGLTKPVPRPAKTPPIPGSPTSPLPTPSSSVSTPKIPLPSSQPTSVSVPKAPPPTVPTPVIKSEQALATAMVRLPPEDPSKEISGTRTEYKVKMNRMRLKIAQRLKEAQNVNAMLTTFNEIDMSAVIEFRKNNQDAFTKKHGIKLGFMSPFLKATAYALQDQPVVNAVIVDNEIVYRDYIDISVAIATPKGLVVPVIRNVESLNYGDIEKAITALGEKAKKGKLTIEDMDGGTFTVSNGGIFGSLLSTPIINMPQSAILGMHATIDRPVVIKGQIVIRSMMYVALTYDHRLIDGREAVLFLRKIKAAIEDPRIIVSGL